MGRGQSQPVTGLSRGFVAAIRVQMARLGMSQTALGKAAGMSAAYLSTRMNHQLGFTTYDVERLAEALHMTPEALFAEAVKESEMLC